MIKKQTQIKINMSLKLKRIIKKKADGLGLSMAGFMKFAALSCEGLGEKKKGKKKRK